MEGNLEHVSTLDQLFLINWKLFLLRKFLLTGDVSNYSCCRVKMILNLKYMKQ